MRRSEKRMREFAMRRLLLTPLLSSPNRKRNRGEDGEWTATPEKSTEPCASVKEQETIPKVVYRPPTNDLTGAEKIPENGKFSDPGSPKLRKSLVKNLEKRYLIQNLFPNMTVAGTRSIMAERTYVDDMRIVYNKDTDDEDTVTVPDC